LGGRGRWISEFEASLVYRVSSRTARAIQRKPVLEKQKKKKKEYIFLPVDCGFGSVACLFQWNIGRSESVIILSPGLKSH
jgi:hypothetical protein